MESYLRECKESALHVGQESSLLVILGNESCDLDSAVSALVLAYFYNHTKQIPCDVVLPILNVKRKDLNLHSEVVFFLEETSVNLEDVICSDEIDLRQFALDKRLKVILVDHNVLAGENSYIAPYVVYMVDHHVYEEPHRLQHCDKKIEPVGSCCTLVAETIFAIEPSLIDPQICMLLYGTILLDTVCLEENAKRVTAKDVAIVSKLEKLIEGISREEVFQALQKAKFDISGFTLLQLLQKDLKVVFSSSVTIAMSSVPVLLQSYFDDGSLESATNQFCSEGQYQAVLILGSIINRETKSIKRQITVSSPNFRLLEKLSNFLMSLENPSLQLELLLNNEHSVRLYQQNNSGLSRKFVFPAISNFCNEELGTEFASEFVHRNSDPSVDGYQAETLDFPDSPNHAGLIQFSHEEKDNLGKDNLGTCQVLQNPNLKLHLLDGMGDQDSLSSGRKKISVHPSELQDNINDDQKSLSSLSNKSDGDVFSPTEDIVLPEDEDIDTPEELENSDMSAGLASSMSEQIPEMSAAEEYEEERSWKTCLVSGEEKKIDIKVIEPYKKVLSHGGYHGDTRNAIILFSACYLPDRSRKDYDYVMDNLFLYVLTTLDQLVAEDYILVYLHGATARSNMPSFGWLKRCYQMIDRRLRKNLKGLYLVHPTFWLKTIVIMTRPFISSKFSRKLRFVSSLEELSSLIPMDHVSIPEKVRQLNFDNMIKRKKKKNMFISGFV